LSNGRTLRHNDIVCERDGSRGFWPGRVWKRVDENHVIVIDCGKHVTLYRDDQLMRSDYRGRWLWGREPGNHRGRKPVWSAFTSLRQLKKDSARYNGHFGGRNNWGRRWTEQDRVEAMAELTVYEPRKAA